METSKRNIVVFPVPESRVLEVINPVMEFLGPAADTSEEMVSRQSLRDLIVHGTYGLWVVIDDNELLGAFTLEWLRYDYGDWVNIPFAGFKKELAVMNAALQEIERVSKDCGFDGVKWVSADPRFETYARRKGYRPRLVEYVKEIE